jgi:hypothetical protein
VTYVGLIRQHCRSFLVFSEFKYVIILIDVFYQFEWINIEYLLFLMQKKKIVYDALLAWFKLLFFCLQWGSNTWPLAYYPNLFNRKKKVEKKDTWTRLRIISKVWSNSGFTRVNRNLGKATQPGGIPDAHVFHVFGLYGFEKVGTR